MLNKNIYVVEVEGSGAPRIFYDDEDEAIMEAKRLASKYLKTAYIFKAVKRAEIKTKIEIDVM